MGINAVVIDLQIKGSDSIEMSVLGRNKKPTLIQFSSAFADNKARWAQYIILLR